MTKKDNNIKNNKKFWKWIASSLFLILFGTSAIINIAYLPKYFALKNHQNENKNQVLNINVTAYDQTNTKLFSFEYQTIMATLGDLMSQSSQTYHLKNWGGSLGRSLIGISYDNQTILEENPFYWIVYYNNKSASVGIDSLYLHKNDNIELHYSKYQ